MILIAKLSFILLDITESFLVDFPLPVDQVSRHVHQIQNAVNRLIPVLQHKLLVLNWSEIDDTINTINPARNDMLVVESANFLLAILSFDLQQLTHSAQS